MLMYYVQLFPNNAASEWNGMNKTDTRFKLSAPKIIVGLFSVVFIDQENGFPGIPFCLK